MAIFQRSIHANTKYYIQIAGKNRLLYSYDSIRDLSDVPSERKADFVPRVISQNVFPDIRTAKLKRGTGGRSSFNGQIVTVFGATGTLGTGVVHEVAKHGAQLIIPYRGVSLLMQRLKLAGDLGQVLFFPFNLKDEDSIYKVMKYSNVVINCIGKFTETTNYNYMDVHCDGARRIARIAKQIGVKRFIHVSSMNVTPNPTPHVLKKGSQWLRSKYFGEVAVKEEFPEAIIFRPSDIYGDTVYGWGHNMCRWHRRQANQVALHNGGYDIFKQPVALKDVCLAICNSITDDAAPGTVYEAYGPRRYELRDLVEYMYALCLRTKANGYEIVNLRWAYSMHLKIFLLSSPKWLRKYPYVSWDHIERECISDTPTGCPTLEDLGVKLTFLEDRFPVELYNFRNEGSYVEECGEFLPVDPPKVSFQQ